MIAKLEQDLAQVPYLSLKVTGSAYAEFFFRSAIGRMQCCELGTCLSLAFPRRANQHQRQLMLMQRASLLLASSDQMLNFGLQNEGDHWLLWQRFESTSLCSPYAIQQALDNLLTIMRFLYQQFVTTNRRLRKTDKLIGQFV